MCSANCARCRASPRSSTTRPAPPRSAAGASAAAHLEGKGVTVLDMTGLAQKGGAVLSHVRVAAAPDQIHAVRIAAGDARLLLGCDLVVSGGAEALSRLRHGVSRAIVNSQETITGAFTRTPDP